MKRTLQFLLILTVFYSSTNFAQTKVWDFGNDATTWPLSPGIGNNPIVVDNLGLFPIPTNTNFGAVNANSLTFADGYSATRRFQMNGGGYPSGPFLPMPTQRYLFFGVSSNCTVKVWFRTGSNGSVRTLYVSNGTSAVGSFATNSGGNGDFGILEANHTGGAGTLYIYGDLACNLYKVEVSGTTVSTTLSNNIFDDVLNANVYSSGKNVYLSNIQENTTVSVYNLSGQLVKSLATKNDIDFSIEMSGIYILKLEAENRQKTVKVSIL